MTTERERLFIALEATGLHRDDYSKHSTERLRAVLWTRTNLIAAEADEAERKRDNEPIR